MISAPSKEILKQKFLNPVFESKQKPTLYAMAGIPASGKSTFVAKAQESGTFPKETFILDPDLVMNALDEYHKFYKQEGAEKAFETYELPTRTLAYDFLEQAVKRKLDIVQDMGNARLENVEKIEHLKNEGYKIKIFFMYANIETAIKRAQKRKRHTAPEMIVERAASFKTLIHDLINVADEFVAYNNEDCYVEISNDELLKLIENNY